MHSNRARYMKGRFGTSARTGLWRTSSRREAAELLEGLGYELFDIRYGRLHAVQYPELPQNTLALPRPREW